jgi:hypothetical protein
MGGSAWDADLYHDRVKLRAATGKATFGFHDDIKTGKVAADCHPTLDPKGLKIRESRDSDAHPTSRAIVITLDQTGSMSSVPGIVQKALPKLMELLIRQGYIEHPQILISAIGDYPNREKAPLQFGQFESGIEIENDLTNLYLEGAGGGTNQESYELALYAVARHTDIDCWNKRGELGYMFIIGDEAPYASISRQAVVDLIGDSLQADIPTAEIVAELKQRYHVYYVLPNMTNHWGDPCTWEPWVKLLGQNCLKLEDPAGICELIAGTIALNEGKIDLDGLASDMDAVGTDKAIGESVSKALATVKASANGPATPATLPNTGAGSGVTGF